MDIYNPALGGQRQEDCYKSKKKKKSRAQGKVLQCKQITPICMPQKPAQLRRLHIQEPWSEKDATVYRKEGLQ